MYFYTSMGCRKLSYGSKADIPAFCRGYQQGRALEVNPFFFTPAVENNDPGSKNCLNSSTYGFNGKEKDDEWTGVSGATYDYGFRIYDARIAKFLSVDPLTKSYPWYTPYQFAGNSPIANLDLDGLEEYNFLDFMYFLHTGRTRIKTPNSIMVDKTVDAIEIGLGFTPPGIILDAKDAYSAFKDGNGYDIAFALAAFIPAGDLLKGIRKTSKIIEIGSKAANKGFKYGPYKRGSKVLEFTSESQESFVRVFKEGGESGPMGRWIMKESELLNESGEYLSPVEIQKKFSLPSVPNKILDVEVPSGKRMRVGEVGAKVNKEFPTGTGGGTQFQLIDQIPDESFKNVRDLK